MKRTNLILVGVALCSLFIINNPTFAQGLAYVTTTYTVGHYPVSVAVGDVNGDGKLDLISANANDGTLTVLTNNGHAGFVVMTNILIGSGAGSTPYSVLAVDVNGDGKMDLVSANAGDGTLTVLTNRGGGVFALAATLTVDQTPACVVAADVNGDGKPDLVSASYNYSTLTILTNDGSGNFVFSARLGTDANPLCVIATDLNGDGKIDLVCANYGSDTLSVFFNNGDGTFSTNATLQVGANPASVIAVDVKGDGKVDLVCANSGDNSLSVLKNNGMGKFSLSSTLLVGRMPESVAAADLNGDGYPDLICADFGVNWNNNMLTNMLTIFANNGLGRFGYNSTLVVGFGPYAVIAVDVNGGGQPDLISANIGNGITNGTITVLTPASIWPPTPPTITTQPQGQVVQAGSSVTLAVTTFKSVLMNYQWYFNGFPISGAINPTMTLNSVTAANSGGYSVVVSNPYGSVTSATATLAVLTEGANGNTPTQPTRSSIPAKSGSAKNLVFVTHGWEPLQPNADLSWMADITNDIAQQLQAKGQFGDWQFETYSWLQDASTINPDTALNSATNIGAGLGIQIAAQGWQQVHLIAHSAGAGMIQEIANAIHANSPSTVIQMTFLDPFLGFNNWALSWYGSSANWSDDYYTAIDETSVPNPFAPNDSTGLPLPKTYAVDVSWVDPNHEPAQYLGPGGGPVALSSHGYPIDFYTHSITNTNPKWGGAGYGFVLSMEDDGANWINVQTIAPVGSGPILPDSPANAVQNPIFRNRRHRISRTWRNNQSWQRGIRSK